MPVEDKPVHELTRKRTLTEGCYNRAEFKSGYWCQDGWEHSAYDVDGMPHFSKPRWVWVPDTMSRECRANHAVPTLPGCVGCKHLNT